GAAGNGVALEEAGFVAPVRTAHDAEEADRDVRQHAPGHGLVVEGEIPLRDLLLRIELLVRMGEADAGDLDGGGGRAHATTSCSGLGCSRCTADGALSGRRPRERARRTCPSPGEPGKP